MKIQILFLILGLIGAEATASAQGFESSFTGFKLETCRKAQECLTVLAPKTQGSQMKMLHTLQQPEVTITSPSTKMTLRGDTGYVDITQNQVVLFQRSAKKITEMAIDLNDFSIISSDTRVDQ